MPCYPPLPLPTDCLHTSPTPRGRPPTPATDASRGNDVTRAVVPEGGMHALINEVTINGEDKHSLLKSGETMDLDDGAVVVYFPSKGHANDAGPLDGE